MKKFKNIIVLMMVFCLVFTPVNYGFAEGPTKIDENLDNSKQTVAETKSKDNKQANKPSKKVYRSSVYSAPYNEPINFKSDKENLVLNKTAKKINNDQVEITLEAYAKGRLTVTSVPSDIILVLDESGSMWDKFGSGYYAPTRMDALKEAANGFVDSVAKDAKDNDVDHRIGIVGFDGDGSTKIDLTSANDSDIKDEIDELSPGGATRTDLGMEEAEDMFADNPIKKDEKRNRMVIMFTDGVPTSSDYFDQDVANSTIQYAYNMKNKYKAKVYTVGIFNGANPKVIAERGSYYNPFLGSSFWYWNESTLANRFMNLVSGNYNHNNLKMDVELKRGYYKVDGENIGNNLGTPIASDKYLTADDSDALEKAFQDIAEGIEGESLKTSVVDVVQPQFTVPSLGSIKATLGGKDVSKQLTVDSKTRKVRLDNITLDSADVNDQNDIDKKKVVIKFTINRKADFIGGNKVLTNDDGSGIETKNESGQVVELIPFTKPNVDLSIDKSIGGVSGEKSIYVGDSVNEGNILSFFDNDQDGLPYKIADKTYKTNGINNKYVDLEYTIFNDKNKPVGKYIVKAGNKFGYYSTPMNESITENSTYKIQLKVNPINSGTYGSVTSKYKAEYGINVFTPVITAKNAWTYLTENIDLNEGIASVNWISKDNLKAKKPTYQAPKLDYKYQYGFETTSDKMKEYPEYNTDITITSVSRSLNGGTMELLKAGHAEINKVPMGEGTFKVLVSKPTISYIDDTVFTKTKVALEDSQKDITWSKVIENKVKPVFDYKYFVEKSNEEVKTIQPMVESSTKINVGVISKSGEDITDKIDFKRLKYINPEFEDFNYIGDNHSGKTDDIEFVIHAINRASSIKIKKIVNNYNSNLKGDSFIINLNSDNFETSLDLKHNETSKTMRIASNTVVDFKEVEPKEYKYNKIVVLNDKGQDVSKYYLNGTKVKVGDEENLTVVISSGFTNQNFFHNDNMSSQTFK